jgi:PEP-CTERM motif-containing protein
MILYDRRFLTRAPREAARGRLVARFTLTALIAILLNLFPAPASAGLILQVENASAQAGGTGSFDVVLSATAGSFPVAGFSVELSVAPTSGISFTTVSVDTTTAPYIFTTLQSPPLTFASFPTNDFIGSDSYMSSPGYVTLSAPPTVTVGLEHVAFAVAAGTPSGDVPVSILIGDTTQILDNNGNLLPFASVNGTITVTGSAVPEPASLVMGLIGMALAGGAVVLRRRRPRSRLCGPATTAHPALGSNSLSDHALRFL